MAVEVSGGPKYLRRGYRTWGIRALKTSAMPDDFWFRPVVIIDSGSGADEACFLEHWRYQLEATFRTHRPYSPEHQFWLLYPDRHTSKRYGSCVIDERYDSWEIRPARWNKPNYPGPFIHTVAEFEEGRHRMKVPDSPWWNGDAKRRRACYVYPNPTKRDTEFIAQHAEKYRTAYNMVRYWTGPIFGEGFHPHTTRVANGLICYTNEGWHAARAAYANKFFCTRIVWQEFGHHLYWDRQPRAKYAFALNWGNATRRRVGSSAYGWPRDGRWPEAERAFLPDPHAEDWQTLMGAVRAENYIILSTKETLPFDALLAETYGARIIAPDIPLYRNLPLTNRVLYPVHQPRNNEAAFGHAEIREFLRGVFCRPEEPWQPSAPPPSPRRTASSTAPGS